jgi:hypothetical protein
VQKFIVDIVPVDYEGFILLQSAIRNKYPTAPVAAIGTRICVELLVHQDWPESAQKFFAKLQEEGFSRSWSKASIPMTFAQPHDE